VRDAGYKKTDAFSPFPLHEIDEALGIKRSILPFMVFGGGIVGLASGIALQWFVTLRIIPIIVGGPPDFQFAVVHSAELRIDDFAAAFTAVFGMIALNGLAAAVSSGFSTCRVSRWRRARNSFY
jgi:hypothetical protein